jgi:hypothetical protein
MPSDLNKMLGRMTDLGTTHVDKTLALQLYGEPGVGKTVMAVQLAKWISGTKPVLYIDTAENFVSLENHAGLTDNVIRLPFEDFGDFGTIALAIHRKQIEPGCVVIDEFSTACDRLLDQLYRDQIGAREGEIPTEAIDPRLYKPMSDAAVRAMQLFGQEHVHLIVIAHEREVADTDDKRKKIVKPSYSPKNNDAISRALHVSAHLSTKIKGVGNNITYEREIQSHPSALVSAKSRIGGLPIRTDPATFAQVIHDWITTPTTGFIEQPKELALDPELDEVPVLDEDEPVLAQS